MPHFVIECSENVFKLCPANDIMQAVYLTAEHSGLFAKNDIKVRILPFTWYRLAESKTDFLHVFGYIMQGRTNEQKAALSKAVIHQLNELLPGVSILSMNIFDFDKQSYSNKALIDPRNYNGDRHFNL